MTRGTLYAITDKQIISTTEFNGSMYPSWYGKEVIEMLEEVTNLREFVNGVKEFNEENFDHEEKIIYAEKRSLYIRKYKEENFIRMTDKNYFKLYFSDWTFWKNLSSETVVFKTRDKGRIELKPNEQVAISFGRYKNHYKTLEECHKIIENEQA